MSTQYEDLAERLIDTLLQQGFTTNPNGEISFDSIGSEHNVQWKVSWASPPQWKNGQRVISFELQFDELHPAPTAESLKSKKNYIAEILENMVDCHERYG